MYQLLKIPMSKDFLDEFEDAFVGQEKSSHRFVFELLTALCRDAKNCKLVKNTPVNRWVDRKKVQETIKFKDINFNDYTLPSNSKWLPKDMDESDVKSFDLKLRDKTMEYLKLHGQLVMVRIMEYNKSTILHEGAILDDLRKNNSTPEEIKAIEEQNIQSKKLRDSFLPTCLEQAIYEQIFPKIYPVVNKNIEEEFLAEFNEEYKDYEKERKKAAISKQKKVAPQPPR